MSRRPNEESSDPGAASRQLQDEIASASRALMELGQARDAELARSLALILHAVAAEATRTARFANALHHALEIAVEGGAGSKGAPRRSGRRDPGVIDPFAVYASSFEAGLREQLAQLSLEQLRDILAEHGMDNDRLAMKWKDSARVRDRIVERVTSRAAKGSAFRTDKPAE